MDNDVYFITETSQSPDILKNLRFRLGMKECYHVPAEGKDVGIVLYWTE
jgi:hypothetical protein